MSDYPTPRDTTPDPAAVGADRNAIFQGMTDAVIARQQQQQRLPPQLASSYQPPIPTALQPPPPATPPAPGPQQSPAPWATQPGRLPGQVAINTPQIQLTPQVVQQPPQLPPRTGERPPLQNMPQLWNGGTVGPSGQTKQQFLIGRMMHESQGDPQALNYVARGDPRMYDAGYTAQGLLQDVNSTWEQGAKWAAEHPDQYPMSVDPRQYKTAREAPWDVQWQVNSAIYDHRGETPWREQGGGFRGVPGLRGVVDQYQPPDQRTPHQNYLPAEPRSFHQWGQDPPGQPARPNDIATIFDKFSPLLLGIASLALRLPLSTAITAYGAMGRAQYNAQQDAYERSRTQWQDAWKEASAKQNLESGEYGDAFATYGENNPQGLQQTLAQLALKYNDPQMLRLAEQGDLNGAHRLQAQRDMLNQNLVKGNKALEEQRDREALDADVAARDRKFLQEHPDATPDEIAIEHVKNQGLAGQDVDPGKAKSASDNLSEPKAYDVVKDGKVQRTVYLRDRKDRAGFEDAETGQPFTKSEGEELVPHEKAGADKLSEPKTWDVVGPDGKVRRTVNLRDKKSGPGFEDAETGEPFTKGPDEQLLPHVAKKADDEKLSEPKAWDVIGPDGKVRRTVNLRDRKGGPGFEDSDTGEPFKKGSDETLVPHVAQRAGTGPRFGTVDDLMQRWHEQFVKDNSREPSTDEISKQRQTFAQESKPAAQSAQQASKRLGIAIGEAAGGIDALSRLSASATLGPWGGAQAALSTNSWENFGKSLANKVTPRESRMLNSIASVIARPLALVEATGVATGLVGVTDSLRREFPQANDDGYTVLTKMANLRNIIDAAADQLVVDKSIAPEIREQIARHRDQVDEAINYTLNDVINAEVNPSRENMKGLAERLLHKGSPPGQGRGSLPPGVTVEVH